MDSEGGGEQGALGRCMAHSSQCDLGGGWPRRRAGADNRAQHHRGLRLTQARGCIVSGQHLPEKWDPKIRAAPHPLPGPGLQRSRARIPAGPARLQVPGCPTRHGQALPQFPAPHRTDGETEAQEGGRHSQSVSERAAILTLAPASSAA